MLKLKYTKTKFYYLGFSNFLITIVFENLSRQMFLSALGLLSKLSKLHETDNDMKFSCFIFSVCHYTGISIYL